MLSWSVKDADNCLELGLFPSTSVCVNVTSSLQSVSFLYPWNSSLLGEPDTICLSGLRNSPRPLTRSEIGSKSENARLRICLNRPIDRTSYPWPSHLDVDQYRQTRLQEFLERGDTFGRGLNFQHPASLDGTVKCVTLHNLSYWRVCTRGETSKPLPSVCSIRLDDPSVSAWPLSWVRKSIKLRLIQTYEHLPSGWHCSIPIVDQSMDDFLVLFSASIE